MTYLGERWKRIPIMYRTATIASGAAVLIGVLIVGLIFAIGARSTAENSAREAKSIAQCVNDNLADRNGATALATHADSALASANTTYSAAFASVIAAIVEKQPASVIAQRFATFAPQVLALKIADAKYQATLAEVTQIRSAHPLGKC